VARSKNKRGIFPYKSQQLKRDSREKVLEKGDLELEAIETEPERYHVNPYLRDFWGERGTKWEREDLQERLRGKSDRRRPKLLLEVNRDFRAWG